MQSKLSILSLVVIFFGCGKDLPTLEGIDNTKWKDDKNACSGYRQSMESTLKNELPKLKALAEMDIIKLLGRPDQNELYKRNQKFYLYYVAPGAPCNGSDSLSRKLIVRFSAMGYAQLVSIE